MTIMNELAKEYGTGLFLLACEEHKQNEYAEALSRVETAFSEVSDLLPFLTSPGIPMSARLSTLEKAFDSALPQQVLSYLMLLCEKGRLFCLTDSIAVYRALWDREKRVRHATVTSAVALTDKEKEALLTKLETKYHGKIQAEYRIDSRLLGGLTVEIDGNVLDGSLRHRLRGLKEVMMT